MSRTLITLLSTSFLVPTLAYAAIIPAESSKIVSATVYTDRATVVRQASVTIPAGAHSVTFSGLPTTIFPDSLRAEGEALASVKFGAVVYKQVMAAEVSGPRAKELSAELETLNDQKNILNGEKAALDAKKTFLTTIGTQAALRTNENIAEINLKPEQWTSAAQAIFTSINEVMTAIVAVDAKLRDLDRQIEKVQADLYSLGANQYSTYTVTVPLESPTSTQLTLDLSYQVSNASWNPIYDARVDTETAKLNLIQYGAVRQATGEDWSDVALTLSTAQPQRGTSLPDLTPQWIDLFDPATYRNESFARGSVGATASNYAPVMMAEKAVMMDQVAAAEPELKKKADFATAAITTGGFVSEYKIPGPATITADGTETKVMVGQFATESTLQVHIKPQLSTDAFLVAKAKLKGDSPILAGQVSLFRDGAYVGQSNFPLLRPDEEYALYFGTDDQISVKRKVLKDEKKMASVMLMDNYLERHFITEIQNLHTKPIEIVVKETTPVGRNEKISTDLLDDLTTKGYEEDSANIKGLLRWQMTLEPKAKADVKLGWKVSWPKDSELSGI